MLQLIDSSLPKTGQTVREELPRDSRPDMFFDNRNSIFYANRRIFIFVSSVRYYIETLGLAWLSLINLVFIFELLLA